MTQEITTVKTSLYQEAYRLDDAFPSPLRMINDVQWVFSLPMIPLGGKMVPEPRNASGYQYVALAAEDLGVAEIALRLDIINASLGDVHTSLGTVHNDLTGIDNAVDLLHADLGGIDTAVDLLHTDLDTTIHAVLDDIYARLADMQANLDAIKVATQDTKAVLTDVWDSETHKLKVVI